jgi:ribosomal protein L9
VIKAKFANTQNPMMLKMQAKMSRAHIKALENQIKFTRKMKEAKARRDLESAQKRIEKLEAIIAGSQGSNLGIFNSVALKDARSALDIERSFLDSAIARAKKVTVVEMELDSKAREIDDVMNKVRCHEIGYNLGTDKHIRGEC